MMCEFSSCCGTVSTWRRTFHNVYNIAYCQSRTTTCRSSTLVFNCLHGLRAALLSSVEVICLLTLLKYKQRHKWITGFICKIDSLASFRCSKIDIVRCVHPTNDLFPTRSGSGHVRNFWFSIDLCDVSRYHLARNNWRRHYTRILINCTIQRDGVFI